MTDPPPDPQDGDDAPSEGSDGPIGGATHVVDADAPVAGDPDAEIAAAAEREETFAAAHAPLGASVSERIVAAITGTGVIVTILAIVSALVLGAIVVALSTDGPPLLAIQRAYRALLTGSLGGVGQISETLVAATPLIATGLAVAIPLRAGLFNIGAEGQVIAGGLIAGLVGFSLSGLPLLIHLPLAVLAGLAGGAFLGWIPGILKARTGAHEVITTIMLNNTMLFVTTYLLSTELYRQPGRADPISQSMAASARFPRFPGMTQYRVNTSIVVIILLAILVFWLLERSTTGFELGAVGSNPDAATSAGMDPRRAVIVAMAIGGALAGAAGGSEILGIQHRVTDGFSAGVGFDGITVALLGRGGVGGTVLAGLLFGALKSGGRAMQAQTGTSLDLVVVIQALIIVFIAAPGLVRAIYRIRTEGATTEHIAKGWGS